MDYEKLFPGRFIKSADMGGREATLEISAVRSEDIDGKPKAILSFQGTKKEMVMNRTNAESIKLMFGRETDNWIGKKITIYPATIADPFNGGSTTAIRVLGSPNITKPASATVQRGRKTIKVSVAPTGNNKGATKAAAARRPPPAPPPTEEEGGGPLDGLPPDETLTGEVRAPDATSPRQAELPTEEDEIVTPSQRFFTLARESGLSGAQLTARAKGVLNKTSGWTHADIDTLEVSIRAVPG